MRDLLRVGMRIRAGQGQNTRSCALNASLGRVALAERGILGALAPESWQTADRLLLGSALAHRHATEPPRRGTGATPARELLAPLLSGIEAQLLSGGLAVREHTGRSSGGNIEPRGAKEGRGLGWEALFSILRPPAARTFAGGVRQPGLRMATNVTHASPPPTREQARARRSFGSF
eukprot:5160198-Pyramimonas_sp.AAC.1